MIEKLNDMDKPYLRKRDIQKLFGYGRDKTRRLLESGILPVVKVNQDYLISAKRLEKWFVQNEGKQIKF